MWSKDKFVAETVRDLWFVSPHHQKRVAKAGILHWPCLLLRHTRRHRQSEEVTARQRKALEVKKGGSNVGKSREGAMSWFVSKRSRCRRACSDIIEQASSDEDLVLGTEPAQQTRLSQL